MEPNPLSPADDDVFFFFFVVAFFADRHVDDNELVEVLGEVLTGAKASDVAADAANRMREGIDNFIVEVFMNE